jgi:UDP-N-acetylglucosamine--N-acetylmuramyl-(pentapeptide) pyrophosphoryl-undecaprenol N-acetylglucosamine transferase
VYPALAVLQTLQRLESKPEPGSQPRTGAPGMVAGPLGLEVLWIGGVGGMEAELVKRAGVPFESIPAAGVHGVGLRALPGNLWKLFQGFLQSRRLIRDFQPQVMLFTGGFVAVPVALAGRLGTGRGSRPRSLLYVPDIEPGLALKTLARFASCIAVTVAQSREYFSAHQDVMVTGYPTRPELQRLDPVHARQSFGLSADLPTLLVLGGSKGARSINRAVMAALPGLLDGIQVLHITGQLDWSEVEAARSKLAESTSPERISRYRIYPYLHEDMAAAFSAADLVVSRAGASTLGELPLFALPAILVPYPHAWRYQQVNAQYLAERGAAEIIQDADLHAQLYPAVIRLLADQTRLDAMRLSMRSLSRPDAGFAIANQVLSLAWPRGDRP